MPPVHFLKHKVTWSRSRFLLAGFWKRLDGTIMYTFALSTVLLNNIYIIYIIQFSVVLECKTMFYLHFLFLISIESLFTVESGVKPCTTQRLFALKVRKISDHPRKGVCVQRGTQGKHRHQSGCHVRRHKPRHPTAGGGVGQAQRADPEPRTEPVQGFSNRGRRWQVERGECRLVPHSAHRSGHPDRRPEGAWLVGLSRAFQVGLGIFGAHQEFYWSDDITSARSQHRLKDVPFVVREDLGHDVSGVSGSLCLAAGLRVRGGGAAGALRAVRRRGRTCALLGGKDGAVPVRGQVCPLIWGR